MILKCISFTELHFCKHRVFIVTGAKDICRLFTIYICGGKSRGCLLPRIQRTPNGRTTLQKLKDECTNLASSGLLTKNRHHEEDAHWIAFRLMPRYPGLPLKDGFDFLYQKCLIATKLSTNRTFKMLKEFYYLLTELKILESKQVHNNSSYFLEQKNSG